MTDILEVRGTDLRYLLTAYLFDHGPATVDELVDALTYHGFRIRGRGSKSVSDALRWEMARGRAIRFRRGRYRPGCMPMATEHRIFRRVRALHDEVAGLSVRGGREAGPGLPAA
jgi:hypothetical protein